MDNPMLISCHDLADRLVGQYGQRTEFGVILPPAVADYVRQLRSCDGNCSGNGLLAVSLQLAEREHADHVIALLN